jgi:hypothetical protein
MPAWPGLWSALLWHPSRPQFGSVAYHAGYADTPTIIISRSLYFHVGASSRDKLVLPRTFDVLRRRLLVLGAEEAAGMARKPRAEPADLLAQPVDRLDVHVGLSDHLGHVDCARP